MKPKQPLLFPNKFFVATKNIYICLIFLLQLYFSVAIVENRWSQFRAGVTFHGCARVEGAFDIARGLTFGPDFRHAQVKTDPRYAFDRKQRELDPTIWIQVCEPDPQDVNQYYRETFRFDGANGGIAAVGYKLLNPIANNQSAVDACNADWIISPWGDWHGKDTFIRGRTGQKGEKGVAGEQGPSGIAGSTGASGLNGLDGLKGTKGIPGINGAEGLRGPQGATGPSGLMGDIGATGETGPTGCVGQNGAPGAAGQPGPQGATGPQGETGPTGPTGAMGVNGTSGVNGENGLQGATGPSGATGINGVTGLTGPIGETGITGATGVTGDIGLSGVIGDIGAVGVTGPSGLTGNVGATGLQGPTGEIGATGATGAQGITGPVGVTGATGPKGEKGLVGPKGNSGPSGIAGNMGQTGPKGVKGPGGLGCVPLTYYLLYRNPKYINNYNQNTGGGSQTDYLFTGKKNVTVLLEKPETFNILNVVNGPMCTEYCDRVIFSGYAHWNLNFANFNNPAEARTLDLRYSERSATPFQSGISAYINDYYWILPSIGTNYTSNQPSKTDPFANRNFQCRPPKLVVGFVTSFIARSSLDTNNLNNRCLAYVRIDWEGRVHAFRIGVCNPTYNNGGSFNFFSHLDFHGLNYVRNLKSSQPSFDTNLSIINLDKYQISFPNVDFP